MPTSCCSAGSVTGTRSGRDCWTAGLAAGERRHAQGDELLPGCAGRGGGPVTGRTARVERVTKETQVLVELDLDGTGVTEAETGVPFFDHMLAQLGKHGCIDLTVRARGDI